MTESEAQQLADLTELYRSGALSPEEFSAAKKNVLRTTGAAADWFPDPTQPGWERWWDGATWGPARKLGATTKAEGASSSSIQPGAVRDSTDGPGLNTRLGLSGSGSEEVQQVSVSPQDLQSRPPLTQGELYEVLQELHASCNVEYVSRARIDRQYSSNDLFCELANFTQQELVAAAIVAPQKGRITLEDLCQTALEKTKNRVSHEKNSPDSKFDADSEVLKSAVRWSAAVALGVGAVAAGATSEALNESLPTAQANGWASFVAVCAGTVAAAPAALIAIRKRRGRWRLVSIGVLLSLGGCTLTGGLWLGAAVSPTAVMPWEDPSRVAAEAEREVDRPDEETEEADQLSPGQRRDGDAERPAPGSAGAEALYASYVRDRVTTFAQVEDSMLLAIGYEICSVQRRQGLEPAEMAVYLGERSTEDGLQIDQSDAALIVSAANIRLC